MIGRRYRSQDMADDRTEVQITGHDGRSHEEQFTIGIQDMTDDRANVWMTDDCMDTGQDR